MTLDIDSLPIRVHGQQAGAVYNRYYGSRCYHPLLLGNAQSGQLFGGLLRPGNASTADGAESVLHDYLNWIEGHLAWQVTVRGDAGFPSDSLLTLSVDTFRQRYLKVAARVTPHSRRIWIAIAAAVPLWARWWDFVQRLDAVPGLK